MSDSDQEISAFVFDDDDDDQLVRNMITLFELFFGRLDVPGPIKRGNGYNHDQS